MNEANETPIPNLREMDEREARRFLTELRSNLDLEEEYNARHPEDYVMEMPQFGKRIRGRERMRRFQMAYPTPPNGVAIRLGRVLVREGLWVVEGVYDYDGGEQVLDVMMICELRDGKMWRDHWYFAGPSEASEWRAQWVERMETGASAEYGPEHRSLPGNASLPTRWQVSAMCCPNTTAYGSTSRSSGQRDSRGPTKSSSNWCLG